MGFWTDKHIVVAVGGGIAAYRTLDVIRCLRENGAVVTVVATKAALEFTTRLSLQVISGQPVHSDLFDPAMADGMDHIRLAQGADLVIVAPATADLLAKMAAGLANDLLTALLLARKGPVLVAPAMNTAMWEHPATRRNVETLKGDGIAFVGPERGFLACGDEGCGRLATVDSIVETARRLLSPTPLLGHKILITAGPTREELDPVRFFSNHSSGKMGWSVCQAALRAGAEVILVHGPVAMAPPFGAKAIAVTSAQEMFNATLTAWDEIDHNAMSISAILTAAVADFRPAVRYSGKIKKKGGGEKLRVELEPNPDILATLAQKKLAELTAVPKRIVVGFAAETEDILKNAREKLIRKQCDLLVVNDLLEAGAGFGVDTNRVTLLDQNGHEEIWPLLTKEAVGERLVQKLVKMLENIS